MMEFMKMVLFVFSSIEISYPKNMSFISFNNVSLLIRFITKTSIKRTKIKVINVVTVSVMINWKDLHTGSLIATTITGM